MHFLLLSPRKDFFCLRIAPVLPENRAPPEQRRHLLQPFYRQRLSLCHNPASQSYRSLLSDMPCSVSFRFYLYKSAFPPSGISPPLCFSVPSLRSPDPRLPPRLYGTCPSPYCRQTPLWPSVLPHHNTAPHLPLYRSAAPKPDVRSPDGRWARGQNDPERTDPTLRKPPYPSDVRSHPPAPHKNIFVPPFVSHLPESM